MYQRPINLMYIDAEVSYENNSSQILNLNMSVQTSKSSGPIRINRKIPFDSIMYSSVMDIAFDQIITTMKSQLILELKKIADDR